MSDVNDKKRTIINEGIFIALIPVYAFLLTYLYELGYCNYFGIPRWLIEINYPNYILALLSVLAIISFSILLFITASMIVPTHINPLLKLKFIRNAIIIIYYIISLYLNNFKLSYPLLIITLLIVFSDLVLPLLQYRKIQGYINKLIKDEERESEVISNSLYGYGLSSISLKTRFFIIVLFLLATIAYFTGKHDAMDQKEFTFVNDGALRYVVLRAYNNKLICGQRDGTTKQLDDNFLIIDLSDGKEKANLQNEKIGPLLIKK